MIRTVDIVNEVDEMAHSYKAPFWNHFRGLFLEVLREPTIKPFHQAVIEMQESLLKSIEDLIATLRQIRRQLATRYGVPFTVPSPQEDEWI